MWSLLRPERSQTADIRLAGTAKRGTRDTFDHFLSSASQGCGTDESDAREAVKCVLVLCAAGL
jgi:hypothetical protein